MTRNLIFCAFLFISSFGLYGQEFDDAITARFEVYRAAMLSNDIPTVASMYPSTLIEVYGGISYLEEEMAADIAMYESIGLKIKDISAKTGSKLLKKGDSLQGMLPYSITYLNAGNEVGESNYLLTISYDDGLTWYFIDMKKYDKESISAFFADYDDRLNVFIKGEN